MVSLELESVATMFFMVPMKQSLVAFVVIWSVLPCILLSQHQPGRTLLLRIDGVTQEQLFGTGIVTLDEYDPRSLVSLVRDTAMVIATRAEAELLRERGFRCTTLIEDTSTVRLFRRARYGPSMNLEPPLHSYSSILHEIDSFRKSHPSLVKVFPIGRTSQRRQTIYAVRIAHDLRPDQHRPTILFNGCHHSDELLGAEICLGIVHELTKHYGIDPQITRWLDSFEIIVVPVVNVDGHDMVTSGGDPRWGKNARDNDGNGEVMFTEGVNLNRNYDFNWAHGGSADPADRRYRGPYPFSETETRAIAELAQQKRFLLSISYHSQGEVVYYPWNWNGRKAPHDRLLTDIARGLAGSIRTMRGDTSYRAEYGAALVGQSFTWLYGVLGTFDFVVETGKWASFPPSGEVESIVRANLSGVRYLLSRAEGPGMVVNVKDAVTGDPLEAEVWLPAIESEDVRRRTTRAESGTHRQLLSPGSYEVIISRQGYETAVLRTVTIGASGWTVQDVALHTTH